MFRAMHLQTLLLLAVMCSSSISALMSTENGGSLRQCTADGISLRGLTSPAIISESIFVHAEQVPPGAAIIFYIDERIIDRQDHSPYWLGGLNREGEPNGFRVDKESGKHQLHAVALIDNRRVCSNAIAIEVIRSNNATFSSGLTPYKHQFSLSESNDSRTFQAQWTTLSGKEGQAEIRRTIATMYRNWGFDPFLDSGSDQSEILRRLTPKNWAPPRINSRRTWSMAFSPDAVFYHRIPVRWPRVALPDGYFRNVQLNTAYGGDGIGFGEVVGAANSSRQIIRSQWYNISSTLKDIPFLIPSDWSKKLPDTEAGDRHLIFIDPAQMSFVSAYKASISVGNGAPTALYAAGPTPFNSLGDRGGSIAANFAELPLLIHPGESTDPIHPIPHAIGGPVRRVWAARVYPATAWDAGVSTARDTCSGKGSMNTGIIPYGGVIQLDPQLDLEKLNLSLPARRILQAMQTYGYYVMDYGCADIDIYTALDAAELEPYGGLWGSPHGPGVQNEIQKVITTSTLYVVAPLIKKQ